MNPDEPKLLATPRRLVGIAMSATTYDEAAAAIGEIVAPLSEKERLQVMTSFAGMLTWALVALRATFPGVSDVAAEVAAVYAAAAIIDGAAESECP